MSTARRDALLRRNEEEYVLLLVDVDAARARGRIDAEFDGDGRDRNIRDVLGHLHAWHLLLERWYSEGTVGHIPAIPAEGYTWRELDQLNRELRDRWSGESVDAVAALLDESHSRLQLLVAEHDDADLFDPARFEWTGGTELGEFCLECGGNHYAWARDVISRGMGADPGL